MSVNWEKSKFQCEYVVKFSAGKWRHDYRVVCVLGGINFHYTDGYDNSAGLEVHYRTPPDYMKENAPSNSPCSLIGAPCWHDGTSLYASEFLLPIIKGAKLDEAFNVLTNECAKRFNL